MTLMPCCVTLWLLCFQHESDTINSCWDILIRLDAVHFKAPGHSEIPASSASPGPLALKNGKWAAEQDPLMPK